MSGGGRRKSRGCRERGEKVRSEGAKNRSEKLVSTSLDVGVSVGVHMVDADTTSTSVDIDAILAFGQNSKTCRNHIDIEFQLRHAYFDHIQSKLTSSYTKLALSYPKSTSSYPMVALRHACYGRDQLKSNFVIYEANFVKSEAIYEVHFDR
ncbi:hypothetical protein Taro_036010 [Colocasia esculenta]|uniref:Uncharacterized protein n=1 Tax=Colocasia esculenta TaxID=4460 RepID=A0A843WGI6_COLES|nr:hypothetical protein [Colocasia esculenta]